MIADRKHDASNALAPGHPAVTWLVPPTETAATDVTGVPITQIDTSGNLMVYHRPDQPDGHWAIILVLALVIIWMWVHGVMVVWFSVVKSRWPFPGVHPSMAFCKERWKWKFLGWPVFWFWKPGP